MRDKTLDHSYQPLVSEVPSTSCSSVTLKMSGLDFVSLYFPYVSIAMYLSVQYNLSLILYFGEEMPPPRIDICLELACTPTANTIYAKR